MVLAIIITFISLIGLLILHEFGHFILAKKFGVKVEEFGIGYPPRIFGKKFGETIYSINLLPFGAFVKILGEDAQRPEEERTDDPRSFNKKPIWQRASILVAGCISFWIVSAVLLSVVMNLGVPRAIGDEVNQFLPSARIQIVAVAPNSPAETAGLRVGDTIKEAIIDGEKFEIQKVEEIIDLTAANKGKEIILIIERGSKIFETKLIPRISPPEGEGPMGVALTRTIIESYPWYQAPLKGIQATGNLTILIIQGWFGALQNLVKGQPTGVQVMGPVGIFSLTSQISQLGANYFLQFIATLSIYIAIFNLLPIPAVDGGRLLFLGIEAVRKKPIPQRVEQKINAVFFSILIVLMIWVTIKDIARLF